MSIVGTWDAWIKWNNMALYNNDADLVFLNDGQVAVVWAGFNTSYGKWAEEAGLMVIQFDEGPGAVYTGNVASDCITGIQSTFNGLNEFNGVWYAIRKNDISNPSSPSAPGQLEKDKYSPMILPRRNIGK